MKLKYLVKMFMCMAITNTLITLIKTGEKDDNDDDGRSHTDDPQDVLRPSSLNIQKIPNINYTSYFNSYIL